MKDKKVFLKELNGNKVNKPKFWDYLKKDKDLRAKLFEQYLTTETKPDLSLYLDKHIPKNIEVNKPIICDYFIKGSKLKPKLFKQDLATKAKLDLHIPKTYKGDYLIYKLKNEFYKLDRTKMPAEYYSHTIENTEIYKSLDAVFTGIADFQQDAFKPDGFDRKDTEDFVTDIIRHLEKIELPKSTGQILRDFIDDKENVSMIAEVVAHRIIKGNGMDFQKEYNISYEEAKKNYRKFKIQANNQLTEYLKKPKQKIGKGKPGRKSVEVKEAKEYLQKIELPENKVKFLNALKKEYADAEHKTFNYLIKALLDLGYLKPATNKEYRQAFEKELGRKAQSKTNFNNQFESDPDPKIYKNIKSNITDIIKAQTLA